MSRQSWTIPAAALGLALLGREVLRRTRRIDLRGQVVLITGSSRGLGLAMAREFAREGARIVLCARDAEELDRARQDVERHGTEVAAFQCDITDRQQVQQLVDGATERFGRIDVLVNNAGIISVGPLANQTIEDFERAMQTMFWGVLYPTYAVLPQMRARHSGRIANITSIGGKLSVPHLLPYGAAKFAAVGLSEGLRAELTHDGIQVTTVVPGLMRTGSHLNAEFKGQNTREFLWFSLGASLPLTSISAEAAARQIVAGVKRGDAELILSWQAQLAARAHGLFPGLTTDVLGLVNRVLPGPGGIGTQHAKGHVSRTSMTDSFLEALGHKAARDLNQLGDS
jgi:short-subunit dehydrogenase